MKKCETNIRFRVYNKATQDHTVFKSKFIQPLGNQRFCDIVDRRDRVRRVYTPILSLMSFEIFIILETNT